ncbi:response regulator transcription factor [Oscillospiraceae bacterium LTW-04]|nr:response regulator transcription factor [Oscillospiraceae bacterium MB24-C1]
MEEKKRILIVEDDQIIRNVIATTLTANGYSIYTTGSGLEACSIIMNRKPDLVILDIGLPDIDGFEIIRQVRSWSTMPVVVVSARVHELDKIEALDMGADDYLTKPFGTGELLARVRTALRHAQAGQPQSDKNGMLYRNGGLSIDFEKRFITVDNVQVHLTQTEYKIISLLAQNSGRVLTYETIMKELRGDTSKWDTQTLRVNMANIRRKIEKNPARPAYIFTEVSVGYRMAESEI